MLLLSIASCVSESSAPMVRLLDALMSVALSLSAVIVPAAI